MPYAFLANPSDRGARPLDPSPGPQVFQRLAALGRRSSHVRAVSRLWEADDPRPKAMLSDFGTSEEMLRGKRERTGHTGTMEYMVSAQVTRDR